MFKKFGFSGESDLFSRLGGQLSRGIFILLATAGTVLLSIGSAFAGNFDFCTGFTGTEGLLSKALFVIANPYTGLATGALFFIVGAYGTYQDQHKQNIRMSELEEGRLKLSDAESALNSSQEEVQEATSRLIEKHNELVTTFLKGAFRQLNMDTHARVSLYYEHDEEFYILARYSANPTYSKIHRQKFPLNQGVISMAWQHNRHEETECPSAAEDFDSYKAYMNVTYQYELV